MIYCGTQGLLANVPAEMVGEFEKLFIQVLHTKYQADVLDELKKGNLTDEIGAKLTEVAKEVANRYKA
jgi:F-type H+-transporting ATPase subunit alpha